MPSIQDWVRQPEASSILQRYGLTLDVLLRNFLASLQPHGNPRTGLGYTIAINVFELFSRDAQGQWQFDKTRMHFFTDLFAKVGRPVVVNLRANHFVGEDPLVDELMDLESSYAHYSDGAPVKDRYFSNPVFGPTFALDENIPLNRFRFGGFQRAAVLLAEFDRTHPGILHAVTLAGELHHFLPELANSKAAGQFAGARMTDYSPHSVREFVVWLKSRHSTLDQLNQRFGTSFRSWDEVQPPSHDLHTTPDAPAWSHMDSYADGQLPVFGWAKPFRGSIVIYLDAKPVARAEPGLSRLDVYDAVPALVVSDVGFRTEIDYRKLKPGPHILHAVQERENGQKYLVGVRKIHIAGTPQGTLHGIHFATLDSHPACADDFGTFAWLDHPPDNLSLRFNPFAAEWQQFREHQVATLLDTFASLALDAGIAPEKIYSHQIMPQFEGSWNRVAFAIPKSPANGRFSPGLDLYGGAVLYRDLARFLAGSRYGVCELHPRMGKSGSQDVFLRALEYHRDLGAAFVCPYFMALREPSGLRTTADPQNLQDALLIDPLNIAVGSLFFYSALMTFLNEGAATRNPLAQAG